MGIDVGKAALDVAVDGVAGVPRFAYTPVGIGKLMGRLKGVADARVVVEATGGYEDAVLDACCDAGIWVARINPRQARDFARATGELPAQVRRVLRRKPRRPCPSAYSAGHRHWRQSDCASCD